MLAEKPQKAISYQLSEMVRVLKPGGWLVCAEPDWSTFVIDADDDEMTDMVIHTWKGSFRNPYIGRQLLRRVRAEGLENTWVDGLILVADRLKAADAVYDIYATVEKVKPGNEEKTRAMDGWLNELLTRENREGVMASVTIFLTGGQKRG